MSDTLNVNRIQLAEQAHNTWVITLPPENTLEDVEMPKFFAHVSVKLRAFDQLEVHAEDGSFWALYLVTASGKGWTKLSKLNLVEMDGSVESTDKELDDYYVKFRGPKLRWSIIRKSDNGVIEEYIENKSMALKHCEEHIKAVAA